MKLCAKKVQNDHILVPIGIIKKKERISAPGVIYPCLVLQQNMIRAADGQASTAPIAETNIGEEQDNSLGMRRTEVDLQSDVMRTLGHVFEDGPLPSGLRYCINSEAFIFKPE
jgi:peptide methionine sulfoxide reductase MsrB